MQAISKSIVVWMVVFSVILALTFVLSSSPVFAQECTGGTIFDGVKCVQPPDSPTLMEVVRNVINTMLFVIGILSVVMIIVGGIRYVISGGNSSQVEGARNTILYAIIGLIVAFVAWGIVNFVLGALTNE